MAGGNLSVASSPTILPTHDINSSPPSPHLQYQTPPSSLPTHDIKSFLLPPPTISNLSLHSRYQIPPPPSPPTISNPPSSLPIYNIKSPLLLPPKISNPPSTYNIKNHIRPRANISQQRTPYSLFKGIYIYVERRKTLHKSPYFDKFLFVSI